MMPMSQTLLLPRWLLTMKAGEDTLENHCLLIDGERIAAVGPHAELIAKYPQAERVELPEQIVIPGLINGHAHSAMTLLRGVADDVPLMDWLQNHIWPAEGAYMSREFCEDGLRLAAAEMIRGGTTCVNDMYFFPDASAAVLGAVGLRANVGLVVLDFPSAWAANADEYIHKGIEVHDALTGNPLLRAVFAPHAPYTVSDAPLRSIRKYANELGLGIHMHVHETAFEVQSAVEASGKRPWQRLKELELLGPDFIAVHMTQLTDQEIAEAAQFGVSVAHCPESNLKLASGFCPVDKLLKAGVNVAIGTDGAASNNGLDLFGEVRTGALLAKGVSGDAQALSAPQALHMATLAGAKALGWEQETGSLLKGKSADFIAVNLDRAGTQPVYNVLSHLVYAANRDQVSDVYVAGRALMRDGRLLTVDEKAAVQRARQWQERIKG